MSERTFGFWFIVMRNEQSGIIEENQTGFLFEEARYLDNDLHPDLLEFFNKNRANNASTLNKAF
jgi:hypothetical protein